MPPPPAVEQLSTITEQLKNALLLPRVSIYNLSTYHLPLQINPDFFFDRSWGIMLLAPLQAVWQDL